MSRYFLVFFTALQLILCSGTVFCSQESGVSAVINEEAQRHFQEGRQQVESGNLDGALANFQKVIGMAPNFVRAYNEAGVILTINGQTERAKEMYLRSIQMAPNNPESYSNLALLYEEEGDFANAALCWKRRADMGGSNDPWAQVAAKRLEEIAREYPETYRKVEEGQYQFAFPQLPRGAAPVREESVDQGVRFNEPEKVDLFNRGQPQEPPRSDSRVFALDYLDKAKDYYSRGEYVGALREATIAEYLDPGNREISAFVQEIRQAILQ